MVPRAPAEDRSWVGLIVQAGIKELHRLVPPRRRRARPAAPMAASVFGAAPRELAGVINLQQTVDLVRLSIDVVEANSTSCSTPRRPDVHAAVLATPARSRSRPPTSTPAPPRCAAPGTPGSRPSSSTRCCAPRPTRPALTGSALGWTGRGEVAVVLGAAPGAPHRADLFDEVRRVARATGWTRSAPSRATGSSSSSAASTDPQAAAAVVSDLFGDGPGRGRPRRRATSPHAHVSARRRAVRRTGPPPAGPRRRGRCAADDLLPERALAGDGHARRHLVRRSTCRCCRPRAR